MKKVALIIISVLILAVLGLMLFVNTSWDKTHDAPYPEITATTDSAMIARGKYLAFGPAHCATCHVPMDKIMEVDNGLEIPLSGGWELVIDPGTFRARNLTPDEETGIGKLSDEEIARILRYSVGHDGRTIFPFMPFQEMSDEDLTALISFLRSQEPVSNKIEPTELTFLGKAVMAFGLLKPISPSKTPPKSVPIEPTAEYGAYVANNIANCVGCHTERDLKTGEFTGTDFAGGMHMPPDSFTKGYSFVTPNLTPDQETGIMASWTEEAFINRFKQGRIIEVSPMPWGAFARMNDVELSALYRYFESLDPVSNKVDKIIYEPGEEY